VVNVTKCIWIVSAASAPKTVKYPLISFTTEWGKEGEDNKDGLVIYDNPSLRDLNQTINQTLGFNETRISSSLNTMIVVYSVKSGTAVKGFNITWIVEACPGQKLCGDNKRCILPSWVCNNKNDCVDWADEVNCNGTGPTPPPPEPSPCPKVGSSGVSGWVIVLLIIPMSMAVGVLMAIFGPTLVRRFRGGRYQEFRDFSEVS
jgi:hypothetical protein